MCVMSCKVPCGKHVQGPLCLQLPVVAWTCRGLPLHTQLMRGWWQRLESLLPSAQPHVASHALWHLVPGLALLLLPEPGVCVCLV